MQEQVAAGDLAATSEPGDRAMARQAVEGVERPGHHQPLEDRARGLGAVPHVGQGDVGPAGDQTLHLGLADALDVREGEPDAVGPPVGQVGVRGPGPGLLVEDLRRRLVPRRDLLDAIGVVGGVDVQAEDRDAEVAGVVEDEPFGIHPRVVGEHAGEEGRRVVGLEPRGLVGRQGEGRRVGLAEAERREGLEDGPDPVDVLRGVAARRGRRAPPRLDLDLTLR